MSFYQVSVCCDGDFVPEVKTFRSSSLKSCFELISSSIYPWWIYRVSSKGIFRKKLVADLVARSGVSYYEY